MPVNAPDSTDLEAQREELEAVLRSRYFTRAPILAHLLQYLCERLFAGEANQIKEYSVGVEVFNRGAEFDQNSDSIVRVEANRLRKRLAEYYAGEGQSHQLHITIPLGQYVPEFERRAPSPCEEPVPAEVLPVVANTKAEDGSPIRTEGWFRHPDRRVWWLVGALMLLLLTLGTAQLLLRHSKPSPVATVVNQSPPQPIDAEIGPPVGEEVRILAGAGRSFVDHAGKLWNADSWFEGGATVKSSVQHIWRTQNSDFYRTSRQGQFRYRIPLKKGIYELRLHFAETDFGPESSGTGGEGSRIFTVRCNGKPLLTRFDVVADAGASRTADVKVFPGVAPASDGFLSLEFAGENGMAATLSAIEILPGIKGHIRPVRVLARQIPYYSNDSRWWSPDNYFEGGQMASYTTPVSGTDDPELFETERWGNFTYAIPVAPGKYTLTLYFAARHGDWDQAGPPGSGERTPTAHIFNVFCNGQVLLKDFNLNKEALQQDVVIRKAANLAPSAQGKLLLSFVPVEGYATVTGIEVIPQ